MWRQLPFLCGTRLGTVTLRAPNRRGLLVVSKLDYLALCRSIQVLALLAGSDAKDVEVLDLRHQLAVLHRQTPTPRQPADQVMSPHPTPLCCAHATLAPL
jgi:hypothetical protein